MDSKFRLISSDQSNLNIRFFSTNLSPAPPPYSQNEGYFNPIESESAEKIQLRNNDFFLFNRIGTYYIYTNDNQDN